MTRTFDQLLNSFLRDDLSPEEQSMFLQEVKLPENAFTVESVFYEKLSSGTFREISGNPDLDEKFRDMLERAGNIAGQKKVVVFPSSKKFFSVRSFAVAASILLAVAVGGYYLFVNKRGKQEELVQTPSDVEAPKSTKAVIQMANGRTVSLDSVNSGLIAQESGVTVTKTADGRIVYAGKTAEVIYNTLTNPKGSAVIDMTLADGSHVWLNAGSSVRYPVAFAGNERKLSITGEAYFEVVHDSDRPFTVSTGEVEVRVLGTHFNVNAFEDEEDIKVTLLEGSVEVSNGSETAILYSGRQALVKSGINILKDVNIGQVMAWKNGMFDFGDGTSLQDIMRQVARWYDVEIVYEGHIDQRFGGSISRRENVSKVLEKFKLTEQVQFRIAGNRIIVTAR